VRRKSQEKRGEVLHSLYKEEKKIIMLDRNTNSTMILEDCIELTKLTQKALTLRREILEIREIRKSEKREHDELKQHYEKRLDFGSNHVRHIIRRGGSRQNLRYYRYQHGNNNTSQSSNNDDDTVVLSLLPPYLIRKYDKVVQTTRSQELLGIYARHKQKQNQECIENMQNFVNDERRELRERKAALNVVKQELIQTVAKNVLSYYRVSRNTSNNNQNFMKNNDTDTAMMMSRRRHSLQRISSSMGFYNEYCRRKRFL